MVLVVLYFYLRFYRSYYCCTISARTFKDYLDKWVYSVKDHDELLDKIGGARLMRLKNEPHLGYSTRH